jgi:hypothetical protein
LTFADEKKSEERRPTPRSRRRPPAKPALPPAAKITPAEFEQGKQIFFDAAPVATACCVGGLAPIFAREDVAYGTVVLEDLHHHPPSALPDWAAGILSEKQVDLMARYSSRIRPSRRRWGHR